MTSQEIRQEFESAIRHEGFFSDATDAYKDYALRIKGDGRYVDHYVNAAWWAWRTAREDVLPIDPLEI